MSPLSIHRDCSSVPDTRPSTGCEQAEAGQKRKPPDHLCPSLREKEGAGAGGSHSVHPRSHNCPEQEGEDSPQCQAQRQKEGHDGSSCLRLSQLHFPREGGQGYLQRAIWDWAGETCLSTSFHQLTHPTLPTRAWLSILGGRVPGAVLHLTQQPPSHISTEASHGAAPPAHNPPLPLQPGCSFPPPSA